MDFTKHALRISNFFIECITLIGCIRSRHLLYRKRPTRELFAKGADQQNYLLLRFECTQSRRKYFGRALLQLFAKADSGLQKMNSSLDFPTMRTLNTLNLELRALGKQAHVNFLTISVGLGGISHIFSNPLQRATKSWSSIVCIPIKKPSPKFFLRPSMTDAKLLH